jgi:hypothetical protein
MRTRPLGFMAEDTAINTAKLSAAWSAVVTETILNTMHFDAHVIHTEHVLHKPLVPREVISAHPPLSSTLLIVSYRSLPVNVQIYRHWILVEA